MWWRNVLSVTYKQIRYKKTVENFDKEVPNNGLYTYAMN